MARGKLRIYLGAAPGVGKTYAMLEEAHRRRDRGTDIVVGYVECHGRARTLELLAGLELIPRATVHYRGSEFEEMDLAAILARRPAVVLVDELAHTNVPGSGHAKRWHDVQDILNAGIEVITTVNIQHLESLNDVTESITGVRQRETVPDEVVRAADQIELVDMSPHALRRRMAHGNIYAPEKVNAALSNYFREGNLSALRELALLWLAERVDEGLERYRAEHDIDATWATRERLVVPLSGGPESAQLMRRAARIASRRSGGEWQALYVSRQDGLAGASPDRLTELRAKTEELGGTFHTVVGDDPAGAILDFARAENATQVVIGVSRRGRLSTLLSPGVGERVIAGSGEIDVHIVTHDYARRRASRRPPSRSDSMSRTRRGVALLIGLLAPVLTAGVLWVTDPLHGLATEAMVFMVVVVGAALAGGLVPAVIAALTSGILLNFVFTAPRWTLNINEPENAGAIAMFVIVGIAVATVVDDAARRTQQARKARAEADALTVLAHSLLTASDDMTGLLSSACELLGATGAAVFRDRDDGTQEAVAGVGEVPPSVESATLTANIDDHTVLALAAPRPVASQRRLLKAYAAYAKVMDERRSATAGEIERLHLAEADRTRTALLAAVSHDLRSPLAAIRAAVDSLRSNDVTWSPEDEAELLATIDDATTRLTALVDNLLDMSRIHTGAVSVSLTDVSLAGAVRNAIAPLEGGGRIEVSIGQDVMITADPGLLDRVLANICENALKYTPVDAAIRIDAARTNAHVSLRIADNGPGVRDKDSDRLFAPFQRLGDVPMQDGVGLGLAVARGFMEAMGGTIVTEETPGGGLTFVLEFGAHADAA
jgi:two-component system sensor histidine kinase KdpD